MSYKWMPLLGEFVAEGERVIFRGGQVPVLPEPGDPPPAPDAPEQVRAHAGIALCDRTMVNGTIEADVTFDSLTFNTVCELVFGYSHANKGHLAAGLGGGGALFSVRAWVPTPTTQQQSATKGSSWLNIERAGDRVNLRAGTRYHLTVRVNGTDVTLEVDGVQVARAGLPATINEPRQVGIFCLGEQDITIENFTVDSQRPKAFFDLSAFRVLFYDDSIGGKPTLEQGLREHLRRILGNS